MHKQFDTPEPVEFVVELGSGRIHVTSTETDASTVEVTGPRAEEFHVELNGRQLSVIAPKQLGGVFAARNHRVDVVVPTGSGLSSKTGSADTEATGRYGAVRVRTGSGDFEIEHAESHLVIDSGSGDICADHVGGELRVKSGSGDVEIGEVVGNATVSTGSGDVSLGSILDTTVVKTGSGDILVQRSGADVAFITGSGSQTVARAERGRIRAKTGSGDLGVGIPAGTPVWTDISSSSGQIRSGLAATGKPAEGQEHVELRLRTASGDIVLTQV